MAEMMKSDCCGGLVDNIGMRTKRWIDGKNRVRYTVLYYTRCYTCGELCTTTVDICDDGDNVRFDYS